jgi:PadR family transcriptional regulator
MKFLSDKELLIAELLGDSGPMFGLELVAKSEGQLKRGTVYVTLGRMVEKGLLQTLAPPADEQTPGLPRPRYRLTAKGATQVQAILLARSVLEPEGPEGEPA